MKTKTLLNKIMGIRFEKEERCVHKEYCSNYDESNTECHVYNGSTWKCFKLYGHIEEEMRE